MIDIETRIDIHKFPLIYDIHFWHVSLQHLHSIQFVFEWCWKSVRFFVVYNNDRCWFRSILHHKQVGALSSRKKLLCPICSTRLIMFIFEYSHTATDTHSHTKNTWIMCYGHTMPSTLALNEPVHVMQCGGVKLMWPYRKWSIKRFFQAEISWLCISMQCSKWACM